MPPVEVVEATVQLDVGGHAGKIARFLISGGIATIINLLVLAALTSGLGLWYLLSSACSFTISFAASFVLQKYWTFRSMEHHKIPRQLPLHLSAAFANLLVNLALMYLFVSVLGIWYVWAQLLTAALIAGESFFVLHRIFR
jgi:putative flippase GtrA